MVGIKEGVTTVYVGSVDGTAVGDTCVVTVYTEMGDVNSDGYVNISDVTALIRYVLSGDTSVVNVTKADTNNDGRINISDVTSLISYVLSGTWPRGGDSTSFVPGKTMSNNMNTSDAEVVIFSDIFFTSSGGL